MALPLECPKCSSALLGTESRYCTFCGSELSQASEPAPQSSSPKNELAARFAALQAYPTYDELRAHKPDTYKPSLGMYTQLIGGAIFTVVAGGMTLAFAAFGGPLALFPGIMMMFGIMITASGLKNALQYRAAPLVSLSAAILDERVKLSGGGHKSSAQTQYFATLEDSKGNREEYRVSEQIASKVVPGDIGVAFIKDAYVVEYIAIPV